ncbi:MAG: hypothetical protein C4309_03000, partial [Chloroflexota bacterium]
MGGRGDGPGDGWLLRVHRGQSPAGSTTPQPDGRRGPDRARRRGPHRPPTGRHGARRGRIVDSPERRRYD